MNAVKLTFMVKSASPPRGGYFTVAATDCSREFGFHDVTFSGSPARRCIDWGDGTVQDFASGSHKKVRHVYPGPGEYTVYVPDAASLIAIAGYEDPDDTEEERVFFTETAPRMLVRYKYNPIDRGPTTMTYFYDVINAFRNCSNLVEADMGAGLVSTFMGALTGCASLKTFRFPRYCTMLADDPFAGCASLEGELDLGEARRVHASASQLPFRDCPLLAKVRISRRLHDWLTQNAGWYAANPNLGLPNGTVEIRD